MNAAMFTLVGIIAVSFAYLISNHILASFALLLLPPVIYYLLREPKRILLAFLLVAINLDAVHFGELISLDILATLGLGYFGALTLLFSGLRAPKSLTVAFIPFLLATSLGFLGSPESMESIMFWGRYVCYFLIIILTTYLMRKPSDHKALMLCLLTAAIVPSLVGLYQVVTGTGEPMLESSLVAGTGGTLSMFTRARGLVTHPNFLAFFLMYVTIFAVICFIELRRYHAAFRWLPIIVVPLAGTTLLATYTRGALMGSFIGLFTYALIKRNKWVLIACLALLPSVVFVPGIGARIQEMMDLSMLLEGETSFAWRLNHWRELLGLMEGHLLFGRGFKSAIALTSAAPHNEYISALVETGLLGFCAFIGILTIIGRRSFQLIQIPDLNPIHRTFATGYFCILVPTLITSFSDNVFSVPSSIIYFWIMTGALFALGKPTPANKTLKENYA